MSLIQKVSLKSNFSPLRRKQMYNYNEQKQNIFTEEGQIMFLKIRDKVDALLKTAGSFRMDSAIRVCSGDTWDMLACVDRLVELGEIKELTASNVQGQHRVFVKAI